MTDKGNFAYWKDDKTADVLKKDETFAEACDSRAP